MNLDPSQIVRVGLQLRRLTNTDEFATCVDLLRQSYREECFTTRINERDKREELFLQSNALDDLLGVMRTLIEAAEQQELAELQEDENEFE